VTERQEVGVLTAIDGPLAGSSATGSLRLRKKRRSGRAVSHPCDMSAIWCLFGGRISGVFSIVWGWRAATARWEQTTRQPT
jgi:hypothetical protein